MKSKGYRCRPATLAMLALFALIAGTGASSCSDDPELPLECRAENCPDGCCNGDSCVDPPVDSACGTGGETCRDCTADSQADSCASGVCVCQATGVRCATGEVCTASGCESCQTDCTGKCAGADDGCGGSCAQGDCGSGCCDDGLACILPGDQGINRCGSLGETCMDCAEDSRSDTCASGACICQSTGSRCAEGELCNASGCSACVPDCTGKCIGADNGCEGTCAQTDCDDGCCDADNLCVASGDQSDSQCGSSGNACSDCDAILTTDTCQNGSCTCQSNGSPCNPGQECTQAGCGCETQCEGKCVGADDGCGGFCPTTTCIMGCCTADRTCLGVAGTGDTTCGQVGMDCVDCTSIDRICVNFSCVDDQANSAEFVNQSVPTTMDPGAQVQVSVTMRNTGTATWTLAAEHKLGSQNPQDNSTWGTNRVQLESAEQILPGETKVFTFQVTAPAAGTFNFQWRMLQEMVEWFGEFSPNVQVIVGTQNIVVCEVVRALAGTQNDASGAIQTCIDNTPAGGFLEIPAGVYRIDHQFSIASRAITFRTEGTDSNQAKCPLDGTGCAVFKASTAFADTVGILDVRHDGVVVDHVVLDGNKAARASTASGLECAAYHNAYGYNMRLVCNNCALTNSVTKDALCGTGCEVTGVRSNVTVWRNTVAYNGVHDVEGMWADGVTVHDATGSSFTENEFVDNTDIDLIFGGCVNCIIQDNIIWHTENFSGGAFAALMLHAWPDGATSGNFNGSITSDNSIDCGAQRRCGIGLYLGSDAWYIADVYGGSVYDNTIANAEFGLLIDDCHDMVVHNNSVTNPATFTNASCGYMLTYAYGMGDRSANINTSGDSAPVNYHDVDFDLCIPNWWNP